ncbi:MULTISPECIES: UDP-glucose/GDP-mannose dehydrogenase family protein [unclassified Frankia]|uniref:UDP-glucose dehydrogenase family protein n=1 Tax=unclassified Frankia TaxID=2632575 RepID=UPI001EF740EF|nr:MULTISPECIES: UDP-glucose/GDP-mannose dehydrogenase family protein [unclassified Frankia]
MIEPTDPRLSVIGTGYLGTTHAACMAELGFDVVGVDVDPVRISSLAAGETPFFEPGLEALVRKNLESHRLRFTTSVADAAATADVHFICVGTPQLPGANTADMRHVDAAFTGLLRSGIRPGALIVGKSTVPVGTAMRLARRLDSEAPGVELAWNPEFLREGFTIDDTLRPSRLVFGLRPEPAKAQRAEALLRRVYATLINAGVPVVVTDYPTAELVKLASNAFLATKISFINAMAEICEATGGDVTAMSTAMSYDSRIGGQFLHAGLGFGGGCLPKDIRAFQARADELGVGQALGFLAEVDAVNSRRRAKTVSLAIQLLGGMVAGKKIAVLGAAFKPNSDDIRDSPALDVAGALHRAGAVVTVYDPAAIPNCRAAHPQLTYADNAVLAAAGADILLHLTEWSEFRELDPTVLAPVVASRIVVDGRNALDPAAWRAAGWAYHALGRPA